VVVCFVDIDVIVDINKTSNHLSPKERLNSDGQQLNSDGQQLHQYQQNKQPPLT
jgi:hypothetical protein